MYPFKHCTIIKTLSNFSSCDGEESVCRLTGCDGDFNSYFNGTLYANGSCTENEGHVSIIFKASNQLPFQFIIHPATISCFASVIDASGDKRFSQSLALDVGDILQEDRLFFTKGFGFDKFVKRSTLLSDSSELLPNDCLTLCLEIDFVADRKISILKTLKYDRDAFDWEDGCWYLRLNSEFGRYLCKMSSVFQDMMECPIVESGSDQIPISSEEYRSFDLIYRHLSGFTLSNTIFGICNLYKLADKYDMQEIISLCHQLMISVMRATNTREKVEYVRRYMHSVSELAERFDDDERLIEILMVYSDIENTLEGCTGELDVSNAGYIETEWSCQYTRDHKWLFLLEFSKNKAVDLMDIYK